MKLNVTEVPPEYKDEMLREMGACEFVLSYFHSPLVPHSVYVDRYNECKKIVKCVNSLGKTDPNPKVHLKDILKLYKVTCSAVVATFTSASQDAQV